MPPAPLGVPEGTPPSESEAPTAQIETEPAPSVVGDRYSENADLPDAPAAAESAAPFPTPQPAVESAIDDETNIFRDPSPSDPASSSEAPLPDPESITPPASDPEPEQESDPEPQTETEPEPDPGAEPEPEAEPEFDDADIFGAIEPAVPEQQQRVDLTPTPAASAARSAAANEDEAYDPFGAAMPRPELELKVLQRAGGLLSDLERTWNDDTTTFECRAKLVRVTSSSITLQKSEGTKVNVPLARLATDDLQFVHQQITALRIVRARDAAVEKLAVAWGN
jgi:hypothetical protein